MKHRRSTLAAIVAALTLCSATAYSQLAKPTLTAGNVGWGWFDLTMTGNSITPTGTHWLITNFDESVTLFDSWRHRTDCDAEVFQGRIPSDYIADSRDLTLKQIIGCADATTYIARVRYTDGTQWSPFSDSIIVTTSAEPLRTDDTLYVVLHGHSLMAYNSNCGMNIGDGLLVSATDGYQMPGGGNSFGHALQTELRRTTGRTVTLINWAISARRQSRWMRSGTGSDIAIDHDPGEFYENFIRFYRAGAGAEDGVYLDTSKYKVAAFFFGQNDARALYPAANFADDAASIINELTGKGVKVVYSSIHYSTPAQQDPERWAGAPLEQQQLYYNGWDAGMTALDPANPRLWRGLDFFTLFRGDTDRYLWPDGAHTNLSEGVPGIVIPLAGIIRDALGLTSSVDERALHGGSSLMIFANAASSSLTIRFSNARPAHVTVEIVDILGRNVQTLANGNMEQGEHRLNLDAGSLHPGTYLCRLVIDDSTVVRKFQVSGN